MSSNAEPTLSADEALLRLKAGNERFVAGTARFPTVQKEILADLAKGQHPYATILSCSDSRVPPELIFDAGFGELFIVHVAGNVVSPEVAGSLQYAGRHLKTPLFVVLGHTNCGAVAAAVETTLHGPAALTDSTSRRFHSAWTDRSRPTTHPGSGGCTGRRGQRALEYAPDSRNTRRPTTPDRGSFEARRRCLRNRNGPRPISRVNTVTKLRAKSTARRATKTSPTAGMG